ncbi:TRAP transporter fused permease subunit [Antarcticimicrobium sediminis]|uniref:TRAP transporter fused permease subunit n=1 Tax=Antarcticimicrobium sediminis TaxID=2546227 RepID=A0A4R5EJB2_9RHOB|nr:TRAP transporter fused permease subunit [Antarcticimicrobium sediminis]
MGVPYSARVNRLLTATLAVSVLPVLFLGIERIFNMGIIGAALIDNLYLYLILTLVLPATFVIYPIRREGMLFRLLDAVLALLCFGVFLYFSFSSYKIVSFAWEFAPPKIAVVVAILAWLLLIEAARRVGGLAVTVVIIVFSLYPVFAEYLPGPIAGFSQPFDLTIAYHLMSKESVLGIPLRAFANLVIGFIVFGVVLQKTGAGDFFNNFALALIGGARGGAAKVSILASGGMGSMSGSVVSNILTTGAVTIPAMKRTGFSSRHAAAIEACASTGAVLMPPVMGATAFVMASFLNVPYWTVAVAAAIPSILFYFALFIQIDCYAARYNLTGLPRSELPSLKAVLASGWHYLAGLLVLVVIMVNPGWERVAPFYATLVLLVLDLVMEHKRATPEKYFTILAEIMRAIVALVALLAGIGLIVGGMVVSGLAGTLANDLVFIAGSSVPALLIMGGITSFIFGMGMTVTASYIFLAIVLSPALTQAGLNPLGVHLFVVYWSMLSFITPPVAIGSFVAASLAEEKPLAVGFQSMRFGAVMYILPFMFVLNPALVFQDDLNHVAVSFLCAVAGVFLIASGMQGQMARVGSLGRGMMGALNRGLTIALGVCCAFAFTPFVAFSIVAAVAVVLAVSLAASLFATKRAERLPNAV